MKVWIVFVALFLAACATPYGKMGFRGGVSAQKIDDNVIRVSARGNGWTGAARINDFVFLKSAEEALKGGYAGFAIMDNADRTRLDVVRGGLIYKPGEDVFVRLLTAGELAATPRAFNARKVWANLAPSYIKKR